MWDFFHDHPFIGLLMVIVVVGAVSGIITSFAPVVH